MNKNPDSGRNGGASWLSWPAWLSLRDSSKRTADKGTAEGRYEPRLAHRLTYAAILLGGIATLVGAGHLAAWLGGYLTQLGLNTITMKTNTALCVTLAGMALILMVPVEIASARRWAARVCAALILVVGILTFVENLSGWDFGIDQLLATETPGAIGMVSPNRMGTPASLSFTLLGLAFLLLGRRNGRRARVVQILALAVCLISLFGMVGFLYGAEQFYGITQYTTIAWPTAVSLLLLGLGLLCARPAEGWMAQVTANDPGGVGIRRLLPAFVLLPLLLGWLRLAGERAGAFDPATGTGIMMLLFIITFSALAYHAGRRASRSAQALSESEQQFRTLADAIPQLAWIANADGWTHWYNRRWYEYTGATPQQMEGWGWQSVHNPETLPAVLERWKASIATGEPFDMTFPLRGADGVFRPFLTRVQPMKDAQGRVVQWFGTNTDVEELKRTEEALRTSEERFRVAQELSPDGFTIFHPVRDAQGKVVDFTWIYENAAIARMNGTDPEEVVGRRLLDVFPGHHGSPFFDIYRQVAESREPRILEAPYEGDSIPVQTWFRVAVVSMEEDIAILSQDITDRKRVEETLKWSARRDEMLSQTAARLLRSDDPQSLVEELCRQVMDFLDCHAFFNFLVDEPSGRLHLNACAGIPAEEARRIEWLDYGVAICGCVARDGERIIAEDIPNTPDPRTALVEPYGMQAYCCHPLKVQDRLIGTLSFGTRSRPRFSPEEIDVMKTVTDLVAMAMHRIRTEKTLREWNTTLESKVTQRTAELERRARQLQKLTLELSQAEERERRRIAVILHEDLQQQIAGAKFQLNLVRNRIADNRQRTHLGTVEEMLTGAVEISRNLSRDLSPPVVRTNDLAETLPWLANRVREQQGLDVHVNLSGNMTLHSEALGMFLFRAAQELLLNVIKHARVREADIRVRRIGRHVCLTVSDRGRGFDPRELNGTSGVGLFSLRERTEQLGGRMRIKSAQDKGSRVSIMVPDSPTARRKREATEDPADLHAPSAAVLSPPFDGALRVLLVDDHDIVREGLAALLRESPDIEVVGEAPDGREAINMAIDLRPDVVIMDVSMPVMSGDQATRQIKRHVPGMRVIALSMYDEADKRERMYQAGAEDYVLKTASVDEILASIRGKETRL